MSNIYIADYLFYPMPLQMIKKLMYEDSETLWHVDLSDLV